MIRLHRRSPLFPYTTLFRSLSVTIPMQGPGTRLTYRIRVIEPAAVAPRILASGAVSGPLDTDMRLTLRSEEHTSELQSLRHLVCRLLLEKKKHDTDTVRTSA